MKEVLIPVDFTEESAAAIDFGIELANHLKANLRLMHVKTDSIIIPFNTTNEADCRLSQDVEKWAEELHETYQSKYHVECGVFDYKIREGNVVKEVCNQAKYGDSSIIVLGTHNDSMKSSKWVGSPAYRLVSHAPCPVLVVNKRMELKKDIKKIAVPVDYTIASRKKLPAVAGIAFLFDADVHVVGLRNSDLPWMNDAMEMYVKQVEKYLIDNARVDVETIQIRGREFARNILKYAEDEDIDLITAHVHHSDNPFVRLFQPFTNDLVNKSMKPVLVIPTSD